MSLLSVINPFILHAPSSLSLFSTQHFPLLSYLFPSHPFPPSLLSSFTLFLSSSLPPFFQVQLSILFISFFLSFLPFLFYSSIILFSMILRFLLTVHSILFFLSTFCFSPVHSFLFLSFFLAFFPPFSYTLTFYLFLLHAGLSSLPYSPGALPLHLPVISFFLTFPMSLIDSRSSCQIPR